MYWPYLGALPWQELAETNWDESIHVKGCRYFYLTPEDMEKYLPGSKYNARPLNDFEAEIVDSHIHVSKGEHGLELVSGLVAPEEATEAWIILGSAKNIAGTPVPDQWMVWSAFPGPMLASLKQVPGYEGKTVRELYELNLPIAVKGLNASPTLDEILDFNLFEQDCPEAFIFRGASGTGKTRLALRFIPEELIFSADDFPLVYDEAGKYQFQFQQAAHDWAVCRLTEAAKKQASPIAYCNTNSKHQYYENVEEFLLEQNYSVQIIRTEDLTLSDRSHPDNVHGTPPGVVMRQFLQLVENPHIRRSQVLASRTVDESEPSIIILDKDGTLVTGRGGSIPSFENQLPIAMMQEWVKERHQQGDLIAVASNQAGIAARHKTRESLLLEMVELSQLYPEIGLACVCPDWDGEFLWTWMRGAEDFQELTRTELSQKAGGTLQPFRKPGCGMIEAILTIFRYHPKRAAVFVGNDTADKLAADAAGIKFVHPWEIVLQNSEIQESWS